MDTESLRRIMENKASGRLEHHVCHRVRSVVAVLIYSAECHKLAGGIARAGLCCALRPDFVALCHLEVEEGR